MMSYKTEFPSEYWPTDEEVQKLEAAGLTDSSWHNDAAASWADYDKGLELFVHPINPEDRELETFRFVVTSLDDPENFDTLYWGDDLDKAIASIKEYNV